MKLSHWLVLLCTVTACQYPVDLSTLPTTQKFLVIDAEVTEEFARLNVLYSLEKVSSTGAYTLPKPPAAVAYLENSTGVKYNLKNTTGIIDTLFKGKIGETYQLIVQVDGKRYESTKEKLRSCPSIDTVLVQYNRESFRSPADIAYDGFDVSVEAKDLPGTENYYQWHWVNYVRAPYCNKVYSRAEDKDVLLQCNPPDCWNINYNAKVIVQTDKLRDGGPINQLVVRVPFATPPNKYFLRIEQRSITPSVYTYLKSLETQTENIGTLFDIPAQTRFNPNVLNVTDKSEKLLGVFSVYAFRRKIVYIDMLQKIPNAEAKVIIESTPYSADPLASAPCTEETYRTRIKPQGWIN